MQGKHYVIIALVALAAFAGGFLVANRLNRAEMDRVQAEVNTLKSASDQQSDQNKGTTLSDEEIDAKLAEAERNASDFQFQKGLGIALYRYGAMKQDAALIEKALPVLERANGLKLNDTDVLTALGNAYFDIGYARKQNESLERARNYYEQILRSRPDDAEIRTDVGLTYFLQEPPELEKAVTEFERSLKNDPKYEKALAFYVQALAKQGKTAKSNEALEKLRVINPRNPSLGELAALISASTK